VEHAHLRQRNGLSSDFLQYRMRCVKAIESTQRRDPRLTHCLVRRRSGHRIALPALMRAADGTVRPISCFCQLIGGVGPDASADVLAQEG
jgi:hypothetical protein